MTNKHIENFLKKYYATDKDIYPYAVLIKGIWGIGKTTFIKKSTEHLSEINKKEIYISLFGLKFVSDIHFSIMQCLHPTLTSNNAKIIGMFLNAAFKKTTEVDFRELLQYTDEIKDNEGQNFVFIFDDFERSNLDIIEFLGFVDNLLFVKKCRVVIILDEDKILSGSTSEKDSLEYKKYSEYKKYKEKVIGQTFQIDQNIDYILPFFINEYHESPEYQEILNFNSDLIKQIYLIHGDFNLRILKRSLYLFSTLYRNLENKYQRNRNFINKLFKRFLIYFIEYQTNSEFDFYPSYTNFIANYRNDKLISKFPNLTPFDNFVTSGFWKKIIKENKIFSAEVNEHISNSSYFYNENTEPWRKLVNYYNFEIDENYESLFEAEFSKFNKGEIEDILEFICITELLLVLSHNKIISVTGDELLKVANVNLNRLKESGKFELYNRSHDEENQLGRINYIGKGLLKEFQSEIEKAKQQGRENFLYKESLTLIDLMIKDTQLFFESLVGTNHMPNKFPYEISVLNNIDINKFIECYLEISSNQRNLVSSVLQNRIKLGKLQKEIDWLKSLKAAIEERESKGTSSIVYKMKLYELRNTISSVL